MKYTRVIISRHGGFDVLNVIEEELREPNKEKLYITTNKSKSGVILCQVKKPLIYQIAIAFL